MPTARRLVKDASKRALRAVFEQCQRLGVDVLPRHFYSEVPDIHALRRTRSWRRPYSMVGVAGVEPRGQLEFLRGFLDRDLRGELARRDVHAEACARNGEPGYGPVEADVLFAFVAGRRPARVVQIGCGVSTAVCLLAAEHAGHELEITCVEPYPTPFLEREAAAGRVRLVREKAQDVDPALVAGLAEGDLFFVDSSHTLGPAGEVSRIVLEMLPRLRRGTYAHFHDVLFPYDYDRHLLESALVFWHESVLLHAFLCHNERFRVAASLSLLHYAEPERLGELVPRYQPQPNEDGLSAGPGHFPSATYLSVVA